MTQTLKKQLTALCVLSLCGGATWLNSGALRAQSESAGQTTMLVSELPTQWPQNGQNVRAQCQMNLKQIALGITLYIQDHDEKYPLAKSWVDV